MSVFTLAPEKLAETWALLQLKFGKYAVAPTAEQLDHLACQLPDTPYCFAALNKVSRSFAWVIRQLPEELCMPVCIFYLVLRALDSIEDDMQLPADKKLDLLRNFYRYCDDDTLCLNNIGDSVDYRHLMQHYYKVARAFKQLPIKYQRVIKDICRKMGLGMAEFAGRAVINTDDYNLYCHYVAGLVGHGLSALFSVSGYEDERLKDQRRIANAMGLLLQKTNIIRDYHEDMLQGRIFWHQEIWKRYADRFDWFSSHADTPEAINCLNEMINDALRHVPDCLHYLRLIRHPSIFRFCAIPQVMAMATLAEIYANPNVFRKQVKISRGITARIITETHDMSEVKKFLKKSIQKIASKMQPSISSSAATGDLLAVIDQELHTPSVYHWDNNAQQESAEEILYDKSDFTRYLASNEPLVDGHPI